MPRVPCCCSCCAVVPGDNLNILYTRHNKGEAAACRSTFQCVCRNGTIVLTSLGRCIPTRHVITALQRQQHQQSVVEYISVRKGRKRLDLLIPLPLLGAGGQPRLGQTMSSREKVDRERCFTHSKQHRKKGTRQFDRRIGSMRPSRCVFFVGLGDSKPAKESVSISGQASYLHRLGANRQTPAC